MPSAPPLEVLEDGAPEPGTAFGRPVVPVPEVSRTHAPALSITLKPIQTYSVSLEQAAKPYIANGIFSEKDLEAFAAKHGEKPLAVLLCAEGMKRRLEQACPLTEKEGLQLDKAAARLSDLVREKRPDDVLEWWANALIGQDQDLDETSTLLSLAGKTVGAVLYETVEPLERRQLLSEKRDLEKLQRLCQDADNIRRLSTRLQSMPQANSKRLMLEMELAGYEKERQEIFQVYGYDPADPDLQFDFQKQKSEIESELDEVDGDIAAMAALSQRQLDKVAPEADGIQAQLDRLNQQDRVSLDDLGKLYKSLGKMSACIGDPRLKQTVTMLKNQIRSQVLHELKQEFQQQFKKSLSELERGGASRSFSINIELGAAVSVFGMHLADISAGLEYKFSVSANDDSRLVDLHKLSPRVSLVLGPKDVIAADAAVIGEFGDGKVFPNVDEFAAFHANDLLGVLLNQRKVAGSKGVYRARKADAAAKTATAEINRFEHELRRLKVIAPGDRLIGKLQRQPSYTELTSKAGTVTAGMSALEGLMSAGVSASATRQKFTRRTDLVQTLRDNYGLVHALGTPQQFGVLLQGQYWPGELGDQKLKQLEMERDEARRTLVTESMEVAWQDARQDLRELREQTKASIAALEAEYQAYIHAVNCYDSAPAESKPQLQLLKHRMELGRGAVGRGECLRAMMLTHARLAEVYLDTFTGEESPVTDDSGFFSELERIEAAYRTPQLNLNNEKHIRPCLMHASKAKSTNLEGTGFVNLGVPYTPLRFGAVVKGNRISGHPNPDNDGRYLNVSFKVGGVFKMSDLLSVCKGEIPFNSSSIEFNDDVPWFQFSDVDMGDFGYQTTPGMQVEFNIIRTDTGPRLQYIRVTQEKSDGLASPQIPLGEGPGVGLHLKLGGSRGQVDNRYEYIGNNTLTYLQTRYNGLTAGGKTSGDENLWQPFVKKNRKQLLSLLKNMAKPGTNAHQEMQVLLESMKKRRDIPVDFSVKFGEQLEGYVGGTVSEDDMLQGLNEFMAFQYRLHRTEASKRFNLMQQQKELQARQVWLKGNEIETVRFVGELANGKNGADKELKLMLKAIGDTGFAASIQQRLKEYQKKGDDPIIASALLGDLVQQYQRAVRRK
ncbi:hypothetical protein ACWJJH_22025 [Endozoicomonadaceae bacterium StTr2]